MQSEKPPPPLAIRSSARLGAEVAKVEVRPR